MSANVTQQISGSLGTTTWTSPVGFCGPVLFEMATSNTTLDPYPRSALAIAAAPGMSNTISASIQGLTFNGSMVIASGSALNSWKMTYWQGTAAYAVVSGSGNWKSQPGNSGPLLWYQPDHVSASFAGQPASVVNTQIVNVAQVAGATSYSYNTVSGSSPMTLVWWP